MHTTTPGYARVPRWQRGCSHSRALTHDEKAPVRASALHDPHACDVEQKQPNAKEYRLQDSIINVHREAQGTHFRSKWGLPCGCM